MKKYAFRFSVDKTFSEGVTGHNFLLRCMPGAFSFQRTYAFKLTVKPFTPLTHIVDVFDNEMYTGTLDRRHTAFSFEATGFVLCSKYLTHEPLDRVFCHPTSMTRPTEEMTRLISTLDLPEDPWSRAKMLCALVHERFTLTEPVYARRTAAESFTAGSGDVSDMAQILVTLCRLAGIGARYVSGLVCGVPIACCWAEVYTDGVWRALDPATGQPAEYGYLKIAHGTDVNACLMERSVYRGMGSASVTEHVITTRDTVPRA